MPFIKPRIKKMVRTRITARLKDANLAVLRAYAKMIDEPVDYVLDCLIEQRLATDPDYIKHCGDDRDAPSASNGRRSRGHTSAPLDT